MAIDNQNISDEELIKECLNDHRQYQELLYRRYADKMYNVCLNYSENEDDACDILQEGFIKVFRNLHKFNFEGSFEGWIRRIIVNTALELYRKNKRKEEVYDELERSAEPIIDEIIDKINSSELIRMVNELPLKAAMVLKLYAIEGYSHKEIADQMSITVGTSKSQLNRARALLKESINKLNG